jgi:Domain of unknown function (DUF1083).
MKRIFSVAIIAMMLVLMLIPAHAAGTDVLKGTPTIDGEFEDIYTQSASVDLDNFNFYVWGEFESNITATAYFLWDENYFYVCTVVNDSTISSAGQDYIDASQPNPWQNDAVENWFLDNGTKMKIHNDAHGLTMFGDPVDGLSIDMSKAVYKTSIDGNKYVVETALPFADMKAGREIGFAMQVNDIANNDNTSGAASGNQTPDAITMKCVATEVNYPAVEEIVVEAPAEAAPAAEVAPVAEVAAPAPVAAPQTSDYTTSAVTLMVMAGAAVVMLRKRASK